MSSYALWNDNIGCAARNCRRTYCSYSQTDMSGLIVKPQRAQDKRFGGTTSIVAPVLVADGQWDAFIPHPELQRDSFGDTFGCVSFSAVNCLETMFRQKNNPGVVAPSFSERFTAKQSGTVPGVGNDFATVADCILNNGVILDIQWPYLPDMTVAQFYADLPQDLIDNAKAYIRYFTIGHQFIWEIGRAHV